MLCRKLGTKRADRVDNDYFELITDLGHEASNLLDKAIDRGFVASPGNITLAVLEA